MSNRVKGITVEIGGDTTGLDKALKGVEKNIRSTESTLKEINRLLKLDPKNTELLAQKQKLLQQEIAQTEDKLKTLKEADKQAKAQLDSGDLGQEQYDALQREIVDTENKLKSLKSTVGSSSSTLAKVSKVTGDFGNKAKDLGQSLLPATAAITGVGAASVSMANDFEDSMSQAAGALNKPMSEMENLRQLAIKTGQDTVFSATDAGNAITELAKGGLTEADIQAGALQATMDLAASSGMDLGNAANVVVQAMGAFGLSANESAQAANALAGAAAASSTDVEPLTQGLAQCSAQAKNAGWDIQETTAALGMFADAGITGSDAGTSLKTMLQRLAAPTDTAATEIEKLGIQTRDSQGNLLGASEMAQELQNKLGSLSPAARDAALQTIFGSDATRAATVMMNNGADGLQKYITATNDQTAAQRMANSQMSDTSRAIEEMKGSLETAAITIGDTLAPMIQKVAGFISDLASKFSSLPSGIQTAIVVIAGIVAALGPLLIIIGQVSLGISALTGAFSALSVPILPIIGIIAGVIAAIAAIIAIIKNWGAITEWFGQLWQTVSEKLMELWNGLVVFFTETIPAAFQTFIGFFSSIPDWWSGLWLQVSSFFSDTWNTILQNSVVQLVVDTVTSLWENAKNTLQGIWSGICQIASGAFELLKNVILAPVLLLIDLVTGNFSQLASDAANIWNNIRNSASQIWSGIRQVVTSAASGLKQGVETVLSALSQFAAQIWSAMKQTASSVWNGIKTTVVNIASTLREAAVTAFQRMASGISSALSGLYSVVSNGFSSAIRFITGLPGQAFQWGKDFINGLKNGIMSGVQGIVNAVKGIGDKIRSFLHFSRPDEGPLRDYETWMPDFMEGLAKGIEKSRGLIQNAVEKVSGDMAVNINPMAVASGNNGTTEINFYGNYKFESQDDIDYFMNQAAIRVARRR